MKTNQTTKRNKQTAEKLCESCGKSFLCGANAKKCWCFEIDLSRETLAKLREDFKSCLCEDCLTNAKEQTKPTYFKANETTSRT